LIQNRPNTSCLIGYRSYLVIYLAGFASHGVLNKDPTVWLDGARHPLRLISKNIRIKNVIHNIQFATKQGTDGNF
jgi:hypothetical protein